MQAQFLQVLVESGAGLLKRKNLLNPISYGRQQVGRDLGQFLINATRIDALTGWPLKRIKMTQRNITATSCTML
jgi:hypothetical protein